MFHSNRRTGRKVKMCRKKTDTSKPWIITFFVWLMFVSYIFRFETRSNDMSHVEASAYCRIAGNVQLRRHALHGIRIVSGCAHTLNLQPHIRERILRFFIIHRWLIITIIIIIIILKITIRFYIFPIFSIVYFTAWKAPTFVSKWCDERWPDSFTAKQLPGTFDAALNFFNLSPPTVSANHNMFNVHIRIG